MTRRDYTLTLVAAIALFTAYFLVIPTLAPAVRTIGGPTVPTGMATALMAGSTVTLELTTRRLVPKFGERRLMMAALAVAALAAVLVAAVPNLTVLAVASALFGAGFGCTVTSASTAIAVRVPAERRGRAFGGFGTAATIPSVYAPAAGLFIERTLGVQPVFEIAAACCAASVVAAALTSLPFREDSATSVAAAPIVPTARTVLLPLVIFASVTFAFGGVVSFSALSLPSTGVGTAAQFLLVFGFVRSVVRTASGPLIDRHGAAPAMLVALAAAAVALVALALRVPAAVLLAALVFGAAFAAAQNAAIVWMIERGRAGARTTVTGLWNFAIDGGVALAAIVLSGVGGAIGYGPMLWVLPAPVLIAIGLWFLDRRRSQPAEG